MGLSNSPFFFAVAATVLGLPASTPVSTPVSTTTYAVTDLGTLGGDWSGARSINSSPRFLPCLKCETVVGRSVTAGGSELAFMWTLSGGMQDLGTLGGDYSYAWSVNDSRQVTGDATTDSGKRHAFGWSVAGGMVDLGVLGGASFGGFGSGGYGVNNAGLVTGHSTTNANARHAFLWSAATGTMEDLGTLGNPSSRSQAFAINGLPQVVGESQTALGFVHAFRWSRADGMVDLGTLGGSLSTAHDINAKGQVVGLSQVADGGEVHAFLWSEGTSGMVDLGTLGLSYVFSKANGVNGSGLVVGMSGGTSAATTHAFLWKSGTGMQNLNDLIDPSSRWTLEEAWDINDCGRIVGEGFHNGTRRAFLLTPIPDPCKWFLCIPFWNCNPFRPWCFFSLRCVPAYIIVVFPFFLIPWFRWRRSRAQKPHTQPLPR